MPGFFGGLFDGETKENLSVFGVFFLAIVGLGTLIALGIMGVIELLEPEVVPWSDVDFSRLWGSGPLL
jgi:hypothetical protein